MHPLGRTAAALLWLVLGCGGPNPQVLDALTASYAGNVEWAEVTLEKEREKHPDDQSVREALGLVYYQRARQVLDNDGDELRYLSYLELSVDELVRAVELDPQDPDPHLYLAVIDVYRGDVDGALAGIENAYRLGPSGIACTNLGEIHTYRGDLGKAREWTLAGLRRGAGEGPVRFNQMLIHWHGGNLAAARRDFEILLRDHPYMLQTINIARLPRTPQRFDEFAGYCCGSPGCGPYFEKRCDELGLQVAPRELSKEIVLDELRIEMEKRRRLDEVYRQRKELEIEVQPAEDVPPAP